MLLALAQTVLDVHILFNDPKGQAPYVRHVGCASEAREALCNLVSQKTPDYDLRRCVEWF